MELSWRAEGKRRLSDRRLARPQEAGIRIKGAAGTSVGALNGALICMDDFEKAERIWENISYSGSWMWMMNL